MDPNTITETVNNSISKLFSNLLNSFNVNIFKILDELTFINTDILNSKYFENMLIDKSNSLILIANSLLLGFIIFYAVSYLFSHFSSSNMQTPLQFVFRITISAILVNSCYFICQQIIYLVDLLTQCVRSVGFSFFSIELSFEHMSSELNSILALESTPVIGFFTFDGFLRSFVSFGFLSLLFTYSFRYILIKVLILLSPFALLTICLDSTKWIFKMWLKNFIGLMFIQVVISIILVITMSLKYSFTDSTVKILYIGSLLALTKANSLVREFTSGFSSDVSNGISNIRNSII